MQEQLFAQFKAPVDLKQIGLILRSSGVSATAVELLDPERRQRYLPLLAPVRSKAGGVLQSILICTITTVLGLMAVVVDNVGYVLSLCAAIVLWHTLRRKAGASAAEVLSIRVDPSDADAAKSSLLQFGAVAILGPVAQVAAS